VPRLIPLILLFMCAVSAKWPIASTSVSIVSAASQSTVLTKQESDAAT